MIGLSPRRISSSRPDLATARDPQPAREKASPAPLASTARRVTADARCAISASSGKAGGIVEAIGATRRNLHSLRRSEALVSARARDERVDSVLDELGIGWIVFRDC